MPLHRNGHLSADHALSPNGANRDGREAHAERARLSAVIARAASAYGLTSAQQGVASLMLEGRPLKEISSMLDRHRRTVADHVRELKRKTGSRTCLELIVRLGAPPGWPAGERFDVDGCVCGLARRHGFTAMQAAIVGMLFKGLTIVEAARSLGRHPRTVKFRVDAARRKIGADSCAELAAKAMAQWWTDARA
jgi:DNA-binding CsgD family transcriptional regulator